MTRLILNYTAPTTNDLSDLKQNLKFTGTKMAELAGVSCNSQWRKYTGGKSPRPLSPHILFFIAAQLALSDEDLKKIVKKMTEIGATIET